MSPTKTSSDHQLILERALKFLGRQVARQTHEITNVINIINELAGLIGDMTAASRQAKPLDPERIEGIVERLQRQIKREELILRGVNRLAHSVDVLSGIFGIEELNERVVFLAERPIRLGQASLEVEPPERSASLEGFVLGHQQAVLGAIELALASGGAGHDLRLRYGLHAGEVEISVEGPACATCNAEVDALQQALSALATELGGRLTTSPETGSTLRVALVFGLARANDSEEVK